MITCYLRYIIDPEKIAEFEIYGKMSDTPCREIWRNASRLLDAQRGNQQHCAGLFFFRVVRGL